MDYQGSRRGRHGADPRESPWPADQAPWAPAEEPDYGPPVPVGPGTGPHPATTPQPVLGAASGPHPVLGPASGPHPIFGAASGPHRILGPASGPQRAMGRTPARGFPPVSAGAPGTGPTRAPAPAPAPTGPMGWEQPEPATVTFRPWPGPGAPQPADDGGYYDGIGQDWNGGPVPPASIGSVSADPAAAGPGTTGPGTTGPGTTGPGTTGPGTTGPGTTGLGAADQPSGPRRGGRSARPRHRPVRMVAWLGLVVVLAAAAFGGYKLLYEPRVNAPVASGLKLPTDVASSPNFDPALGRWQHIGNRNQDPAALTLAQLYPPQFELGGRSYQRTAAAVTKNCSLAVFGADLQAALQHGKCTAVLRASYLLGNGTMMGTVGVANLDTSSDAQKAGQATGPQDIIAPLSGQKGATAKLGSGTGVVQAEIKGHYLILMWVEFTNLKAPSTSAQRQQLETFAANLVTGSANIDLSTRMLSGKP